MRALSLRSFWLKEFSGLVLVFLTKLAKLALLPTLLVLTIVGVMPNLHPRWLFWVTFLLLIFYGAGEFREGLDEYSKAWKEIRRFCKYGY